MYQDYPFFSFNYCLSGLNKSFTTFSLYLATILGHCSSGFRGRFIVPLLYIIMKQTDDRMNDETDLGEASFNILTFFNIQQNLSKLILSGPGFYINLNRILIKRGSLNNAPFVTFVQQILSKLILPKLITQIINMCFVEFIIKKNLDCLWSINY